MFGTSLIARHRSSATILLTIAGIACSKGESASPTHQPTVPVEVTPVVQIAAPLELSANGVVEPMQSVSVEAQVAGMLLDVGFREGDAVSRGQVLFQIDPRPF